MKRSELIQAIFKHRLPSDPQQTTTTAYAPINLALCKYWGKRNSELNLPQTSSLSVAVPTKGTTTTLYWDATQTRDSVVYNGQTMVPSSALVQGITQFLDLFRPQTRKWYLRVDIEMNVALSAGFASSSSGFAALVLALNNLFNWNLPLHQLSILARLGSGSAARSLWMGFVEWDSGQRQDGMDSYGTPLPYVWPELCVGLFRICEAKKPISSREAMQRTINTSGLYPSWPKQVRQDLTVIKRAIHEKNFPLLGQCAEQNALTMHAMLLSSWPPICYTLPDTLAAMQHIWALRREGLAVYLTQDAGPNLKLLFLKTDIQTIQQSHPTLEIIPVFSYCIDNQNLLCH